MTRLQVSVLLLLVVSSAGCELAGGIEKRSIAGAHATGGGEAATGGAGSGGAGGAGGAASRWPDSATFFCSDGDVDVDPCPTASDAGYGQDGNYLLQVPSYTLDGDVQRDAVTGLVWESGSSDDGVAWDVANMRCNNKPPAGQWRLPTRLELASLLDYGSGSTFGDLNPGQHWASTHSAQGEPWSVIFLDGTVHPEPYEPSAFVLCVSGEGFAGELVVGAEAIVDQATGLEWQRGTTPAELTWLDALNYCEALELTGRNDWRLPSAKELVTLVRDDQAAIVELGGNNETFWTSTPSWPPNAARTIDLPLGWMGADQSVFFHLGRCVRGPG